MTDKEINNLRLEKGQKADAFSDCTRTDENGNGVCYIILTTDENNPETAVSLKVGPEILKKIIQYLCDDYRGITGEPLYEVYNWI